MEQKSVLFDQYHSPDSGNNLQRDWKILKKRYIATVLLVPVLSIAAYSLSKLWAEDDGRHRIEAEARGPSEAVPRGGSKFAWSSFPQAANASPTSTEGLAVDGNISPNRGSEADRLLEIYKAQYIGTGIKGSELLDTIYAFGLEKNRKNFDLIRSLIRLHTSEAEKVSIIRILASFYSNEHVEAFNNEVLSYLREFSHSTSSEIGRTATFAYSRLGYFTDSEAVLKSAKDAGHIDRDQYSGELAYLLVISPKEAHNRILTEIASSNSQFSAEVLVSLTHDPAVNQRLPGTTIEAIRTFLLRNEPSFPTAGDQFGLVNAIRYSDWLKSTAILSGAVSDNDFLQYVNIHLNKPSTDPRKVVSFLISPDGERLMNNLTGSAELSVLHRTAQAFAVEHPQNQTIQECISEINKRNK